MSFQVCSSWQQTSATIYLSGGRFLSNCLTGFLVVLFCRGVYRCVEQAGGIFSVTWCGPENGHNVNA